MPENHDDVAPIAVQVSKSYVYKAVQNVIRDELNVTKEMIQKRVDDKIDAFVDAVTSDARRRVEEYVRRVTEDSVPAWVSRMIQDKVRSGIDEQALKILRQEIGERLSDTMNVLFQDGLEVEVGWRRRKVKISAAEPKPEEPNT